jgi:hypothetical protein
MALNEREALPGEVSLQLTGSMFSSSLEPYERSRRAVNTRLCCLAARGGVRSDSLVQNTTERDSAFTNGRNRRYSLKFIRMLDGSAYSCSVAKVFIAQGDGCFLRERQRPQRMHVRLLRIARSVGCPTRGCSSQQKSPQTPVERLSERWTGSAGKGQQQSRIRTRPASFMSLRSGVTTTTSGSVTALSKLADASSRQKVSVFAAHDAHGLCLQHIRLGQLRKHQLRTSPPRNCSTIGSESHARPFIDPAMLLSTAEAIDQNSLESGQRPCW